MQYLHHFHKGGTTVSADFTGVGNYIANHEWRCQVYKYSIGKFRTYQKEFPTVLIIVSRFFFYNYSLLAVTVCLLLKTISTCLHIAREGVFYCSKQ